MSRNSPLVKWEMQESNLLVCLFSLVETPFGAGALLPLGIARYRAPLQWFGLTSGEGYLHIASTKVPIAATCRRMRALAVASFWHSSL